MKIIRGDYKVISFVRKDVNKKIIEDIPEKVYLTIKGSYTSDKVLIQKTLDNGITINENFEYNIEFVSTDTDGLDFGKYVYDIEIKNGDKPKTIHRGTFEIEEEVTHAKDEV